MLLGAPGAMGLRDHHGGPLCGRRGEMEALVRLAAALMSLTHQEQQAVEGRPRLPVLVCPLSNGTGADPGLASELHVVIPATASRPGLSKTQEGGSVP